MPKAIWALDFGAGSLKVVRGSFDRKSGMITVDLLDEIPYGDLPCGYDASPRDKQREGIIEFRNRHVVRPGDDLCVSVTGSEVFSRFIKLPPVRERIAEIIGYEARQQIPFDINDVIWDWQEVKEHHEEGEEVEVGLFALKRERVEELLDVLQPWRANLRVIQNAPLAIYNLLEYEGMADRPLIVLDVGAATTDVLVLNPPRFWVRSLLVAGNDLTNALVEKFGVSFEEAEQIKRRVAKSRHREQIMKILVPVFNEIASEIQRSLGYYKSLERDVKFDRVLLLGNALRMAGTRQVLARRLQYQVQTFGDLKRIRIAGSVEPERFEAMLPGLAAPLGLLVQGAGQSRIRINMVPDEITKASAVSAKKPWLMGAAVGLLVIPMVLFASERIYAGEVEQMDGAVDWGVVERVQGVMQKYDKERQQVDALQKSPIATLTQPGVDPALSLDVLTVLAQALPRDVFLVDLKLSWEEPGDIAQAAKAGAPQAEGSRRQGPGGAVGGATPTQGGVPEWVLKMVQAQAGGGRRSTAETATTTPSGMPGGPGQGSAEGFASGGQPLRSANSKLLVLLSAESRVVKRSKEFITDNVIGALQRATMPASTRQAFESVQMVGDLTDVWRDAGTGAKVDRDAPGGAERFVAFQAYAVVNTGRVAAGAQVARPAAQRGQ